MSSSSELVLSKPVKFWNKDLSFDIKPIFKGLGKAAVKIASMKFDEAAEESIEIAAGLGLETGPQEVAFNLIRRSLNEALLSLTRESATYLNLDQSKFDSLGTALESFLSGIVINFNANFFKNPSSSLFLKATQEAYQLWLIDAGADNISSQLISSRLGAYFVKALSSEWVRNRSYYAVLQELSESPFSTAEAANNGWQLYFSHLRVRVSESIFDEPFGLSQIYVPLNAYHSDGTSISESMSIEHIRPKRKCVDLKSEIISWFSSNNKSDAIRVISGGPGSGKSSFTKMLCCDLAERGVAKPIYIPLHLIDPTKDVASEVAKFIADEGLIGFDPLDPDRKEENLLLVFDGLDELASMGKSAVQVARDFVQAVGRMIERRNIGPTPIYAIISGREVIVQGNETEFRHPKQILTVLPYYVERDNHYLYDDPDSLLNNDLRDVWWSNYGRLAGADYKELPKQLRIAEVDEITAQPLLNYLVALSFRRGKLDFGSKLNLNNIYADLVLAVYERAYEKSRTYRPISHLTLQEFSRVLEEVGLAAWHSSDGRTTSVRDIMSHCQESGLETLLTSFTEGAEAGVTKLLAAFFFRRNGQSVGEDAAFVFTHKSFGEYLTAARLVRGVERLVQQRTRRKSDPDDGFDINQALTFWLKITGPAPMTEYLKTFVGREVARRPAETIEVWQEIFGELFNHIIERMMPVEKVGNLSFAKAYRYDTNASVALLVLLNECSVYLKKMAKPTFSTPMVLGNFLKRICPQRNGPSPHLVYTALSYFDFSGQCLDLIDLYGADVSNSSFEGCELHFANFGRASLFGVNFRNTKMNWAHLDTTQLKDCDFTKADLNGVVFGPQYVINCDFTNALLIDAKFPARGLIGCNFSDTAIAGARVEGCNEIKNCNFSGIKIHQKERYLSRWLSKHIGSNKNIGSYIEINNSELHHLRYSRRA